MFAIKIHLKCLAMGVKESGFYKKDETCILADPLLPNNFWSLFHLPVIPQKVMSLMDSRLVVFRTMVQSYSNHTEYSTTVYHPHPQNKCNSTSAEIIALKNCSLICCVLFFRAKNGGSSAVPRGSLYPRAGGATQPRFSKIPCTSMEDTRTSRDQLQRCGLSTLVRRNYCNYSMHMDQTTWFECGKMHRVIEGSTRLTQQYTLEQG